MKIFTSWCLGFAFLLLAFPVAAQEDPGFWDYEALFVLYADEVIEIPQETGPPLRRLNLPGGIVIRDVGAPENRRAVGIDESGAGAVGCMMNILASIGAHVAEYPEYATVAETERLNTSIVRVSTFIADNLQPPRAQQEVLEFYREGIEVHRLKLQKQTTERGEIGPDGQLLIRWVLSEEFRAVLGEILAVPRLPVSSPYL